MKGASEGAQMGETDLQRAMERLASFDVVLVLENYADSMRLLQWHVGWTKIDVDGNLRHNSGRKEGYHSDARAAFSGDAGVLALLEERTLLDRRLYDFALRLNRAQLAGLRLSPTLERSSSTCAHAS